MRLARLPLLLGAFALAAGALGCSETTTKQGGDGNGTGGTGGSGGSQFGETSVYDLQDPARQPAMGTEVVLKDVVVTAVVERRQPDGSHAPQHFFVQEQDGGKWSGIYVRNGSDGAQVVDVPALGDVVDLAGALTEYYDRTQVEVLSLENKGAGTLPAPETVDPEAIATGGAEQEAYEGVLVQVVEAVTTDAAVLDDQGQDRGNFRINSQGRTEGGVLVGTLMQTGYVRVPGDLFQSVVGVLDFSYEESRVEPRFAEDITFDDGSHPGLHEAGEKTVYQLQNPAADGYPHPPAKVTVEDVVVTANGGSRIWVQETEGGPWSGIQVRLPSGAAAPAVGSKVSVTGTYTEYFANAQIDEAVVEVTGTAAVPAPVVVETASIRTGSADAEQWEGVLVQVDDVRNVQDPVEGSDGQDRGDFRVAPTDGGSVENGVIVGHAFDNDYDGEVGDRFQSIVGVLDYTFSEFVLQPRGNEDITLEDGTHPTVPDAGVVSIPQIQNPDADGFVGSDVFATVEDVVVTGAFGSGFFVQETSGEERWSGLYVHVPSHVEVEIPARGSLVTVQGKIYEFFDKTQMQVSAVTVTGTGTLPQPVVVEATAVATGGDLQEAYEGVLVEVRDVANVEDPVPDDQGNDRGDFRVGPAGGSEGVIVGHIWPDDYAGTVGDTFASLVGIMDYSFDEARLETRGNEDITFEDGTHPTPPEASTLTIMQIQNPDAEGHPDDGDRVEVASAVVTAVGSRGFWIQDAGATAWAGIYVYRPNGSTVTFPAVGDLVDVEGTYTEYHDLSQIIVDSVSIVGQGTVPAPVVASATELDGGSLAEQFEGMLVRIEDVANVQDPVLGSDGKDHGDFRAGPAGGSAGVVVGTLVGHDYDGAEGDEFQSIVGVLDYSYEAFRVQPRGNEDITFADGSHPGSTGGSDTYTVHEVQNPAEANHPTEGDIVRIEDVVVTAVVGSGQYEGSFFVADPAGGPWSGVYVFKKPGVSLPAVAVGDVVDVEGEVDEYYGVTEVVASTVTVVSAGTGTVPAPAVVLPSEIATGAATAEQYEGCLVQVQDVTVTNASFDDDGADRGGFQVAPAGDGDPSDDLVVDDLFDYAYTDNRQNGDAFESITGILHYDWNNFRLMPREDADLVPAQQ